MGFVGETWRVLSDGEPVGEITVEEAGFPWLSGRFTPPRLRPGRAAVRPGTRTDAGRDDRTGR